MYSKTVLIISLCLTGCATQTAKTFIPFTVEFQGDVGKQAYNQDLQLCQNFALDYLSGRSSLDASQIASEGLRAGFGDLGYSAVSPTAPALGGLGGASSETLSELGLNSQDAKKIISVCLHDKGQKSDLYHVYDPNY